MDFTVSFFSTARAYWLWVFPASRCTQVFFFFFTNCSILHAVADVVSKRLLVLRMCCLYCSHFASVASGFLWTINFRGCLEPWKFPSTKSWPTKYFCHRNFYVYGICYFIIMLDDGRVGNCTCHFLYIGCAVADDIVVNAFMTVFAYLYWNYKEFITLDFQTQEQKFQVCKRVTCAHLVGAVSVSTNYTYFKVHIKMKDLWLVLALFALYVWNFCCRNIFVVCVNLKRQTHEVHIYTVNNSIITINIHCTLRAPPFW